MINAIGKEYQFSIDKLLFENELSLYRELLIGDFYINIKKLCFNDMLNRDEVKEIVLHRWMNGRVNSRNINKKVLDKRFPKISEILTAIKTENYTSFSNSTMKLESEIVNDIIYKQFVEMHPDAVMYTIFDSFLIEQKYAEELHAIMITEGKKFFGVDCIVRKKTNENVPIVNHVVDTNSNLELDIDEIFFDINDCVECCVPKITDEKIESIINRIFERTLKRLEAKMPTVRSRIKSKFESMSNEEKRVAVMSMLDAMIAGRSTLQGQVDDKLRLTCEDLFESN